MKNTTHFLIFSLKILKEIEGQYHLSFGNFCYFEKYRSTFKTMIFFKFLNMKYLLNFTFPSKNIFF